MIFMPPIIEKMCLFFKYVLKIHGNITSFYWQAMVENVLISPVFTNHLEI